jgi:hypothetical protein
MNKNEIGTLHAMVLARAHAIVSRNPLWEQPRDDFHPQSRNYVQFTRINDGTLARWITDDCLKLIIEWGEAVGENVDWLRPEKRDTL